MASVLTPCSKTINVDVNVNCALKPVFKLLIINKKARSFGFMASLDGDF
jgi:hypothetical protein